MINAGDAPDGASGSLRHEETGLMVFMWSTDEGPVVALVPAGKDPDDRGTWVLVEPKEGFWWCARCGARYDDDPSCGKSVHLDLPGRAL
jgi:hypothetical protein